MLTRRPTFRDSLQGLGDSQPDAGVKRKALGGWIHSERDGGCGPQRWPDQKLTAAFSFVIHCEDQAEVDHYWDALAEGGTLMQCGWLTDRFGLSWQVVPKQLFYLFSTGRPKQTEAVRGSMMQLVKFDVSKLEEAFEAAQE